MSRSYNIIYLDDVENNIGRMLSMAHCFDINPIEVWKLFIDSKIAKGIEEGNPKYLNGLSILEYYSILYPNKKFDMNIIYSYDVCLDWCGMTISRLQYTTKLSFKRLEEIVGLKEIMEMFNPLHEVPFTKFLQIIKDKFKI